MIRTYVSNVVMLINYESTEMSNNRTKNAKKSPVNMVLKAGTWVLEFTLLNIFPIKLSLLSLYIILV
jgi:hypothetical protein